MLAWPASQPRGLLPAILGLPWHFLLHSCPDVDTWSHRRPFLYSQDTEVLPYPLLPSYRLFNPLFNQSGSDGDQRCIKYNPKSYRSPHCNQISGNMNQHMETVHSTSPNIKDVNSFLHSCYDCLRKTHIRSSQSSFRHEREELMSSDL